MNIIIRNQKNNIVYLQHFRMINTGFTPFTSPVFCSMLQTRILSTREAFQKVTFLLILILKGGRHHG